MTRNEILAEMEDMTHGEFEQGFAKDLVQQAFDSAVDAVALECNKRIVAELPTHLENSQYWRGYRDALRELTEWMEYDMKDKK